MTRRVWLFQRHGFLLEMIVQAKPYRAEAIINPCMVGISITTNVAQVLVAQIDKLIFNFDGPFG